MTKMPKRRKTLRRKQQGGLGNLVRTNNDIRDAVNAWFRDKVAAMQRYGDISEWDVSRVTDMSKLFYFDNSGAPIFFTPFRIENAQW